MEITNKYIIQNKIGNGKFGIVYRGIYRKTNEPVAIKTEDSRTSVKSLKHETTVLKYLYDHGSRNVPIVYWYGIHLDNTCLIMTYYDMSLYQYIQSNPDISNDKINRIFLQCIVILESIHKLYVIHCDIKPQNFMLRNGELFLIDFGLSTFYVVENGQHIEECTSDTIIGTPKYISKNIHLGISPSRRDDLISIGYMYIFMFCRELPWESIPNSELDNNIYNELSIDHYKNKKRLELKSWDYLNPICLKINKKIHDYLEYCYHLKYKDRPNYQAILNAFDINNYKETI
jgi:serine/threonine protein kinase